MMGYLLITQNSYKNPFRTKHGSISSKVIAKQQVVTPYLGSPQGLNGQIITKNDPKSWY
jgi:hypothetical protein